ncbi:GTP 3',8-cyclase MoaA [Methanolobus mangrovi]|uniref:Probable GTP 3',8-cyclase n=1 Tax=Methanolobus mangrovi TaxID=3072977 RepID=A0AA51UFI3_9EURY|nr:GTP 3',8-cyclase MoaA [Methanolobus mangrovi]WMW22195.1 GTP 3',8-cyclase MoaA [Methanolobus mangrovi]
MSSAGTGEVLTDSYGRTVRSLRMSITDRCNLNCIYCHNEGHVGHSREMPVDTIVNIVEVASQFGINRLKLSGGEPLLRKDLEEALTRLPDMRDISLTTNAVLLRDRASSLKDAGLDRVNISLDTLDPEKYRTIAKCSTGMFDRVLDGIHAAVDAGLTPVKLNMVLLKDLNDDEIKDMLDFTRGYGGDVMLQLIELMDFRDLPQYRINANEVEKSLLSVSSDVQVRELHKRKKYIINGAEVEFVRPVDNTEFCANCNRLRVSADGKLKPCLLVNNNLVDVLNATKDELPDLFRLAVSKRVPFCRD